MITDQTITVTLKDDQTRGTVQVQDEPARVEVHPAGPRGPIGPDGPPGPPGPPGNSENAISYVHVQMVPQSVWTIRHGLNFFPGGITVQDAAETTYEGEIDYPDSNTVIITFLAGEISGTAYLS